MGSKCPDSDCRIELTRILAGKLSYRSLIPFISVVVLITAALIWTWSDAQKIPELYEKSQQREHRLVVMEERYSMIIQTQYRIEESIKEIQKDLRRKLHD